MVHSISLQNAWTATSDSTIVNTLSYFLRFTAGAYCASKLYRLIPSPTSACLLSLLAGRVGRLCIKKVTGKDLYKRALRNRGVLALALGLSAQLAFIALFRSAAMGQKAYWQASAIGGSRLLSLAHPILIATGALTSLCAFHVDLSHLLDSYEHAPNSKTDGFWSLPISH